MNQCMHVWDSVKIQLISVNIALLKRFSDKKMVKATKNDSYFNRYGCSLYRNKARLSVTDICFCDEVMFLRELEHIRGPPMSAKFTDAT